MAKDPRRRSHFLPPSHWDEFAVQADSPERLLMAAVLARAILDYMRPNRTPPGALRSARAFFEGAGDSEDWPFTFDAIADHLAPNGDGESLKAAVRRVLASGKVPFKNVKAK